MARASQAVATGQPLMPLVTSPISCSRTIKDAGAEVTITAAVAPGQAIVYSCAWAALPPAGTLLQFKGHVELRSGGKRVKLSKQFYGFSNSPGTVVVNAFVASGAPSSEALAVHHLTEVDDASIINILIEKKAQ